MFETISRLLRSPRRPDVVYECRHCGSTVDGPADTCGCCDASGIARYRIR